MNAAAILAHQPVTEPSAELRPAWSAFRAINLQRRAVRDFDGTALEDGDVRAILEEALLAPSSGNLQPYELHWIRDPELKRALAAECDGQRAASSAAALVVIVASPSTAKRCATQQLAHIELSSTLDEESKAYSRELLQKFGRFLRFAPSPLFGALRILVSCLFPALTLVPIGPAGIRHWAARSAVYAAQTLMLAAVARGIDSCPMEGFDARKVARRLGLPRGAVIPIVIALGRRAPDARIEPRWRRSFEDAVVVH